MIGTRSWRPLAIGRSAVASNHPSATAAGIEILRAGGNAVDAAVAVSLALGVAEPFMSGLGGDGFYHVFDGVSRVYEGVGAAPLATSPLSFPCGLPEIGPLAISPPGALAGVAAMHARHGKMPFKDLCQPAIALARDGVRVGHTYRRYATSDARRMDGCPAAAAIYLKDGKAPDLAAVVTNPALAVTLERLAADGAMALYEGEIAERLVSDLQRAGSPITLEDMAGTGATEREPIMMGYRGYEIAQSPPVSTGFTLLQELAMLERFDPAEFRDDPAGLIHLMVEIKKLAFLDRERFGRDPAYAGNSARDALMPSRITSLAARVDPNAAADLPIGRGTYGDTTHFCVADAQGQVVSAIQSLNGPFGSGIMSPSTGILMNNRMVCWHLDQWHPNLLQAGKKVRHTMNAPMVLKDGKPWAALGTPGADNQVQVNFQAIVALIDFGLDPQQVAEAPRWSSDQPGQGANWPHTGANLLTLESHFGEGIIRKLADKGHRLEVVPPLEGPCSLAIIRMMASGAKLAGSDPRRDGWSAAID